MYRLLIVEDEHLIRKWLRYAIDYQSLNILVVGEAKDGKEGAQLIQEEQPDIVLSDINMPIMTAFDMFEATKGQSYAKLFYLAMLIFQMRNQLFTMAFLNF